MGIAVGPHPGDKIAVEDFRRFLKRKEPSRLKIFLWRCFGKKKTRQHDKWLTTYYEWLGTTILTEIIYNGKEEVLDKDTKDFIKRFEMKKVSLTPAHHSETE